MTTRPDMRQTLHKNRKWLELEKAFIERKPPPGRHLELFYTVVALLTVEERRKN